MLLVQLEKNGTSGKEGEIGVKIQKSFFSMRINPDGKGWCGVNMYGDSTLQILQN